MGLMDKVRSLLGGSGGAMEAAAKAPRVVTQIAQPPAPKVQSKLQGYPSYLGTATPGILLPYRDRRLGVTDVARIPRNQDTRVLMRALAHSSPDLSAAMFAYLRTGIPQNYSLVAKNLDGTFNTEATTLAQQLATRFDVLSDYGLGYTGYSSMRSLSEQLAKDIWLTGAMCGELVLGPDRLPQRIVPLASSDIYFLTRKDLSIYPQQRRAGHITDLDIPTFFYVTLDKESAEPYAASPMESAIKPTFFSEEFMADLQRVVKRAVHPRLEMIMDEEQFMDSVPAEVKNKGVDEVMKYRLGVLQEFTGQVSDLEPDDALVHFSNIVAQYINNGNASISKEWETLEGFQNAKMSTGAKTLPSILGHSVGSTNIASTETLQFMKNAQGAITFKLDEFYSKVFTLAVRLFGQDVYVEFAFDDIDLRPNAELESFKQTKQSRYLQLLSLGFVTDEECSIKLTGSLPPVGFKSLSGTRFLDAVGSEGIGAVDTSSNNGSTLNQNLNSDQPSQGRGGNSKVGENKPKAPLKQVK